MKRYYAARWSGNICRVYQQETDTNEPEIVFASFDNYDMAQLFCLLANMIENKLTQTTT